MSKICSLIWLVLPLLASAGGDFEPQRDGNRSISLPGKPVTFRGSPGASELIISGQRIPLISALTFYYGLMPSGTTGELVVTAGSSPAVLALTAGNLIRGVSLRIDGRRFQFNGCISDIELTTADETVISVGFVLEAISPIRVSP